MGNYIYKARDVSGNPIAGNLVAVDEMDLATKLSKMGYVLTQAKEIKTDVDKGLIIGKAIKISQKEVLSFTIDLATLINAGVPLVEGLKGLTKDAERTSIKALLNDVTHRIEAGSSLKDALSIHPQSFPILYTSIVGMAEATGSLSTMLNELADIIEWQLDLKAKIKEVATYPIILFVTMLGTVILLVVKVIPTFAPIFSGAGVSLPLPTQIVLTTSDLTRKFWYIPLIISIISFIALKFLYRTQKGGLMLDSLKLKMPIFGTLIHKIAMTRFSHTLGLTLRGGINILEALRLSRNVVANLKISEAVKTAEVSVKTGGGLSDSLSKTRLFPPLVLRMVAVGERSGSLVQCLQKVNQFYDKEIPATIRTVFALFEPVMIVFMGVVVGGIALALFLPLFKMAAVMGG